MAPSRGQIDESLVASFMARTRVRELVTSMNAGDEGGDGAVRTGILPWMTAERVQWVINILCDLRDGRITDEQRVRLKALLVTLQGFPLDAYRRDPARIATGWLMDVRIILGDDGVVKWAVQELARQVKEQQATVAASATTSNDEASASATRKRPLQEGEEDEPAPQPVPPPALGSWEDAYKRELAYVAGEIKTKQWDMEGTMTHRLRETYASFVPKDDYASYVHHLKPPGHLFSYTHPFDESHRQPLQPSQRAVAREWIKNVGGKNFAKQNTTWGHSWTNQQMAAICKHVANHAMYASMLPDDRAELANFLHNQWLTNLKEEARFWGSPFEGRPMSGTQSAIINACRSHNIDMFADLLTHSYERASPNAAQQHLNRATDFWALHMRRNTVQTTDAWRNEQQRLLNQFSAVMNDATKSHAERQQAADRHEATRCLALEHIRSPNRPTYRGGPQVEPQARPKARPWDGVQYEHVRNRIKEAIKADQGLEARIFYAWRLDGYRGRDEVEAHDDGTYPPAPLIKAALYKRITELLTASEAATALMDTSGANRAADAEPSAPAASMDLTGTDEAPQDAPDAGARKPT